MKEEPVPKQSEIQCACCGSYDGDPYTILSNGYCIPCDQEARILTGLYVRPEEQSFYSDLAHSIL